MQFKHILAATDFSPSAEAAVTRAAVLAQQHGATLHLVHVLPSASWKMFGRVLVEHPLVTEKHLYKAAEERLDNLAESCRSRHAIETRTHVDIGQPYRRIATYVADHAIDLAVLGPHAENAARDLFVGTTVSRFLRRGARPALVARTDSTTPYRRLLVAIDFSEASRMAVEAAAAIAPEASLELLHVYDVLQEGKMMYASVTPEIVEQYRAAAAGEAERVMDEFVTGLACRGRVTARVLHGYPAQVIRDQAQVLLADLVVMGKRGRSELDELFLGSVSENVLHEVDRDLLLVAH